MEWSEIFSRPEIIWFMIGLVFVLLEFTMPGFIIIFFGVGAWVTSLVCLVVDVSLTTQLFIYILTSVVSLLLFRKYLKSKFFKEDEVKEDALEDEFIGKTVLVDAAIKKGMDGKVKFKGAQWSATADVDISKGKKVKIISKESIRLIVEPIE